MSRALAEGPRSRRLVRAQFLRDLQLDLSTPIPFVLELVAVAFGLLTMYFISRIVAPASVPGGYLPFVLTGFVTSAFLSAAILVSARNLRDSQQRGTLEALVGMGPRTRELAAALVVYPACSALLIVAMYGAVGYLLGVRYPSANWFLAVVTLAIGVVAFSGLGVIGISLVFVMRKAAGMVAWIVVVLTFSAGQLFPSELLPTWVRILSFLSPFTWCLRTIRAALLDGASLRSATPSLAALCLSLGVSWVVGLACLRYGVRRALRRGTLSQY